MRPTIAYQSVEMYNQWISMKFFSRIISQKNIAIFTQLVAADFKIKYQGSALGYFWSLLKPLMMFSVLYLVFGVIFRIGDSIPNYPIYLLLGIVLWSFFAETTQNGLQAVVSREDLIKKIRIPRWIVVLSTSASALINLVLNLVVVFVFAIFTGVDFGWTSLLLIIFILEIYILALGLSLLLSALYVRFRDITYIWDVVIQAGFYATPILYPITLITDPIILKIMILSPIASSIQGARDAFVTSETLTISEIFNSPYAFLIPLGISLTFFVVGLLYFRKQSKYFAENL